MIVLKVKFFNVFTNYRLGAVRVEDQRFIDWDHYKGPVELIKQVKIAHSFLVCVKSVPGYHFKLACVILQMVVKEFFETHF